MLWNKILWKLSLKTQLEDWLICAVYRRSHWTESSSILISRLHNLQRNSVEEEEELDFHVSALWWRSHCSLPVGVFPMHFCQQHLFFQGVRCGYFLSLFLSLLWFCFWFHEVIPLIFSVVLWCFLGFSGSSHTSSEGVALLFMLSRCICLAKASVLFRH